MPSSSRAKEMQRAVGHSYVQSSRIRCRVPKPPGFQKQNPNSRGDLIGGEEGEEGQVGRKGEDEVNECG